MVEFTKFEDLDAPPVQQNPDAYVIYAMQLWKQLVHVDKNNARALKFLDAMPKSIRNDAIVNRMALATAKHGERDDGWLKSSGLRIQLDDAKRPASVSGTFETTNEGETTALFYHASKQRIVFWVGPAIEPWDPTTPETRGIGGSETACIEMARELAALGHDVTVFGELPGGHGNIFDGVCYVQWQNARAPIECDIFISSRQAAIMERPGDVQARVKLLWVHDVNVGPDSPQMQRWIMRFDRILCLSRWHKDHFVSTYPGLDPDRVLVTRNGINPERFGLDLTDGPYKKNHLVFSSSPNRGLDTLVHNFPFIRARVPDAELHVYYGFDCWEAFARARGATDELAQIEAFKKFLTERAHPGSGIHLHGRVNQRELADAFLRAKVWPHWTQFTETSCISAMEAQAAGCVAVHSGIAALAETVKHGALAGSPQEFVELCVRALTDDAWRRSIAEPARVDALADLSWRSRAAEWEAMFRGVASELAANPLPRYVEVGR
jgi:glycosyltransferase involved in cell wall biosynthesis